MSFLQLLFKSGRPFWDNAEITAFGHCKFDFASPSTTTFTFTFIFPYLILNYFMKYNNKPNVVVNGLLWTLFTLIMFDVWFISYVDG